MIVHVYNQILAHNSNATTKVLCLNLTSVNLENNNKKMAALLRHRFS